MQRITSYCPYYLYYLYFPIKILPWQHSQWHQSHECHDWQTSLWNENPEWTHLCYSYKTYRYKFQDISSIRTNHIYFIQTIKLWRPLLETEHQIITDSSLVTPYHLNVVQILCLWKPPWKSEHRQHQKIWNNNEIIWRDTKHKNWHKVWWSQIWSI